MRPSQAHAPLASFLSRQVKCASICSSFGLSSSRWRRVYAWGNATSGALGVPKLLVPPRDDKSPVLNVRRPYQFPFADFNRIKVTHIAAGFGFTVFAGLKHGKPVVYGCGINTDSQLGYVSEKRKILDYVLIPQPIELPLQPDDSGEVTAMSCGRAHSVICTSSAVFTLGNNSFGQCGRPVVEAEQYRGSRVIHRIGMRSIQKAVCGHDHTLLLNDEGRLYSCGLSADGQTGHGTYDCIDHPKVLHHGDVKGERIVDVSSRCDTVLAVSDSGDLFGWGNSEYNQLSLVTDQPQVNTPLHLPVLTEGSPTQVAAAGTKWAVLDDLGHVYVCGWGILGAGPTLSDASTPLKLSSALFGRNEFSPDVRVASINAGINYFTAITDDKRLYTWGKNSKGVLGLGHQNDQHFPFMVCVGAEVEDISCGADHIFVKCREFV